MLCLSDQKLLTDEKAEKKTMEILVVSRARDQLQRHEHFRSRGDSIDIDCKEGLLVLEGRVPSFYLKQVLQTVLRGLPGVRQIINQVDVVSPTGLSSVKVRGFRKVRQHE